MEIFKLHNDVIHDYKSYIKSFVNIADQDIHDKVDDALSGGMLSLTEAEELLTTAGASESINPHAAATSLNQELALLPSLLSNLNTVAEDRCKHLVEAHERFSKAVGGTRYNIVKPVIPMDIMGIYVLLPENGGQHA